MLRKYKKFIKEFYEDQDGYWCILKDGYYAGGMGNYDECHVINAEPGDMQEIIKQLKQVKPV